MLAPRPAVAAADCKAAIADLRADLETAGLGTDSVDAKGRIRLLFGKFVQEHPECEDQVRALASDAASSRQSHPGADAKGFLGPVGWLWNTVFYRVYQGNGVMMATVGWALFLAPVILVFAGLAVIRGATGAFRRLDKSPPAALSVHE